MSRVVMAFAGSRLRALALFVCAVAAFRRWPPLRTESILAVCAALAILNAAGACGDSSPQDVATDGGSHGTTSDATTDGTVEASADASGDHARDTNTPLDAGILADSGADSSTLDAGHPDSGPPPPFDGGGVWQATPTGSPAWLPVAPHLFAAPLGNSICFGPSRVLYDTLASPNHRWFDTQGAVGPGQAHAGPYDQEFGPFIAAHGYTEKTVFSPGEFTPATGVYFVFTVVPSSNAPTGSSADGVNGPILPNALFPLTTTGVLYRNGVVWDPNNGGSYPPQTALGVPSVAGASHVPLFFNDNMSWAPQPAPPVEGNYEWHVTVRDANAEGWDIQIPYVVQSVTSVGDAGADAGCGDTQNDPSNCGSCGRDCHGGTCAFGRCQPVTLAIDTEVGVLAIDATNAYFVAYTPNGALLNKVPLVGGPVTNLRSDISSSNPSFAVDTSSIYWFGGSDILKAPIGGGPFVSLGPASPGWSIVVDSTTVYWAEHTVQSLPIAGGSATRLDTTGGEIYAVAVDATNVYWVNGTTLQKAPKGGGVAPTTMYSGFVSASNIAVDGTNVYVIDWNSMTSSSTVYKVPLAGGPPVSLADMPNDPNSGPVVDGQNVYFSATHYESGTRCSDLVSVPIVGGAVRTLATEQPNIFGPLANTLAVDGANVYWTYAGHQGSNYHDGAVMKVAK